MVFGKTLDGTHVLLANLAKGGRRRDRNFAASGESGRRSPRSATVERSLADWFPVNGLIIRGLVNMYPFYGNDFKVECPNGSGNYMNLYEVAKEIGRRNTSMFLRDANGRRPVYGGTKKFQEDPYWRDYILFYEYFHGDNGTGLGASHQTGWTGLAVRSLDLFARVTAEDALRAPKKIVAEVTRQEVTGEPSRS